MAVPAEGRLGFIHKQADVPQGQAMCPCLLLQVHQHLLLQLILSVGDGNAVVVPAVSTLHSSRHTRDVRRLIS